MGTGESHHRSRTESQPLTHSQDRETRVDMCLIPPFKNWRHRHRGVGLTRLACQFAQLSQWQYQSLVDDYHPLSHWRHLSRLISLNDEDIRLYAIYETGKHSMVGKQGLISFGLRKRTSGAVFVYDITRHETWEDCKVMIQELIAEEGNHWQDELWKKLMIVGCKCDLVKEREVEFASVKNYADENGLLFIETSAMEDINVDYAFVSFAAQLLGTLGDS